MLRLSPAAAFAVASAGIATFSCMDALMKGLTLSLGVYNAMLWRGLASVGLSAALFALRPSPWPTPAVLRLHIMRGLLGAVVALTFFWGLARVPMAQAIALTFVSPLFALLLSVPMLGERVSRATAVAAFIAFAGVTTIFLGQARADLGPQALLGSAAVMVSAASYAINLILMRRQSLVAGPIEATLAQNLVVFIVLSLAAPWLAAVPEARHATAFGGAALLAITSSLLLSTAYRHAEANFLAISEFSAFIWAAILGFLVFGERVAPFTLGGAVLIVGGCFWAARRREVAA